MYRTHFGLNRSPFSIEPDPAFLWLGEMHKEALAALRYAVLENKGFLLLTGGVGCRRCRHTGPRPESHGAAEPSRQ